MSATEKLRELLDERAVEWEDCGYENHTWWSDNNDIEWHAENRPAVTGLYVKIETVLTPEQAIAATLGNKPTERTCIMALREDIRGHAYQDIYECSECGEQAVCDTVMGESEPPNYCPSCGAKVVME